MQAMTIGKALRLKDGDKVKRLTPKIKRERLVVAGVPKLVGKRVFVDVRCRGEVEQVCHIELKYPGK